MNLRKQKNWLHTRMNTIAKQGMPKKKANLGNLVPNNLANSPNAAAIAKARLVTTNKKPLVGKENTVDMAKKLKKKQRAWMESSTGKYPK